MSKNRSVFKKDILSCLQVSHSHKPGALIMQYDIIFLSYDEPHCEAHWTRLEKRFPRSKRVHGVKGIYEATLECVSLANTDHFFLVDGDAYILDDFDFDSLPFRGILPNTTYLWLSRNAVNDLIYQNGGIKLVPKSICNGIDGENMDFFMNNPNEGASVDILGSVSRFNGSSYAAWRAGFREGVKLQAGLNTGWFNFRPWLEAWCYRGAQRPFGKWCIRGAREGRHYAEINKRDPDALNLITNYTWLEEEFARSEAANFELDQAFTGTVR